VAGGRGQQALRSIEAHGNVGGISCARFVHGVADDGDAGQAVGRVVQYRVGVGGAIREDNRSGGGANIRRVAVWAEAEVVFGAGHFLQYLALQAQANSTAGVVRDVERSLQGRELVVAAVHGDEGAAAQGDALQLAGHGSSSKAANK